MTSKTTLPRRAATYVRVSRSDQRPGLQTDETTALVQQRGWDLVDAYTDHGISGSRERRPALDRLLADARSRKFEILVVWRSDRLFRSLRHMVNTIEDLRSMNIDFVSVQEPFDTTTLQGRLLFHMVSAFAEFERGVLIERTCAGLAAAKRRGARLGRPTVSVDVEKALALRKQGRSYKEVAQAVGVGVGTLHRAIKRQRSTNVVALRLVDRGDHTKQETPR